MPTGFLNKVLVSCMFYIFFTANSAPFFYANMTRRLNISFENTKQVAIDLKEFAGDKEDRTDQLQFTVGTTINDTDYSIGKVFILL